MGSASMAAGNLVPCPDCGHMLSKQAGACPSCARPLRPASPRDGLFLRTMNQVVALVMWGPFLAFLILLLAVVAGVLVSRLD